MKISVTFGTGSCSGGGVGAHILPLRRGLWWAVLPLVFSILDAELPPGWGRGCHECPSLFLALQGSECKAVDPWGCFKLLKGLGWVMSNPRTEEMWRQLAACLILLSSSQGKEWRDLSVLVLPFAGEWLRKPLVQEDSFFPKKPLAAHI